MFFEIIKKCKKSNAKSSILKLSNSTIYLPIFMPVGTNGTMKGITSKQLKNTGCNIMLCNTYHLSIRPGIEILKNGIHDFMSWDRSILTDSGGFQMVSLSKKCKINEDGVTFTSPYNNTIMKLTPEKCIEIQNIIGADIIMQLDDVVHTLTKGKRVKEAMERSITWLDRCIKTHKNINKNNKKSILFCIIQGGLNNKLRLKCIEEMVKRNTKGIAIGGLSGGEDKEKFWRIVKLCCDNLPKDKPIYLMGVGYTVDIIVCVALGCDMFDCVYPTRIARFGYALTDKGLLKLRDKKFINDNNFIDNNCFCITCKSYTRSYLNKIVNKDTVSCHLITIHNITYQLNLMNRIRNNIINNTFDIFCKKFFINRFNKSIPKWIINALLSVNIKI